MKQWGKYSSAPHPSVIYNPFYTSYGVHQATKKLVTFPTTLPGYKIRLLEMHSTELKLVGELKLKMIFLLGFPTWPPLKQITPPLKLTLNYVDCVPVSCNDSFHIAHYRAN